MNFETMGQEPSAQEVGMERAAKIGEWLGRRWEGAKNKFSSMMRFGKKLGLEAAKAGAVLLAPDVAVIKAGQAAERASERASSFIQEKGDLLDEKAEQLGGFVSKKAGEAAESVQEAGKATGRWAGARAGEVAEGGVTAYKFVKKETVALAEGVAERGVSAYRRAMETKDRLVASGAEKIQNVRERGASARDAIISRIKDVALQAEMRSAAKALATQERKMDQLMEEQQKRRDIIQMIEKRMAALQA